MEQTLARCNCSGFSGNNTVVVQLIRLTHDVGMASVFVLSEIAAFFILESVREGDPG
jgi:hypothetical protein